MDTISVSKICWGFEDGSEKIGGALEVLEVIAASERGRDAVIAAHKAALKEAKAKLDLAQKNHDVLVAGKKKELEEISDAYFGFRIKVSIPVQQV